ncbi:response regulator [Collimonas silvisoli]|uniref:response regulator n=1 Tax=Collimonas silvisoli TaxID=2825884 RepID=UPI001B8D8B72|nr:response regulator [Collimonas silvisoli]
MISGKNHILIVEDEPRLAAVLGDYLTTAGYTHYWVADGAAALPAFRAERPDLVLLDLMLPGRDGLEICRELRRNHIVPIIMITARIEEIDRLLGLDVGADDYICKPFSPREVVARVGTVLRRHRQIPNEMKESPLTIDDETHRASIHGTMLELTPVEFRLLCLLHRSQGRVFSRDQILSLLYRDHRIVSDRTIDSHVKNLRRRLVDAGGNEEWIKSIYGVGYRMEL